VEKFSSIYSINLRQIEAFYNTSCVFEKKCDDLLKRAKIMYEQSKVRISQLLSAVVCLVIIAVEIA